MSEFSELLTYYIHSKDIKTQELAHYCGLDRSNMYKVICGKRKPSSEEMVDKICKFLHLIPAEETELREAYEIAVLGHDNYYRRKDVLKFFSEFRLTAQQESFSGSDAVVGAELTPDGAVILNSRHEINHALSHIISRELNDSAGHLRLLFQPDFDYLMSFLAAESSRASGARIDHIICLNNDSKTTQSRRNYNLYCLKQVMTLYGSSSKYNCFYYYDNVASKTENISIFPYIVISRKYACLLSPDIQKGYITTEPASIRMLKEIFDRHMNRLTSLLCRIDSVVSQLEYTASLHPGHNTAYSFQMTPCLTPFLSQRLLEKYIAPDLPGRIHFLEKIKNYIQQMSSVYEADNITYIFSLKGVLHFIKTGKISEYPADAYFPLELPDRILLVRQFLNACRQKKYKMLKDNIGNIENELFLFVSQKKGYLMFPIDSGRNLIYLDIAEPGLLFTFYDFCENINEKMFYSSDETVRLLQKVLEKYRKQ